MKGFAYVKFTNEEDSKKAKKETDRTTFLDCEIEVLFAKGERKSKDEMKKKDWYRRSLSRERYSKSPPPRRRRYSRSPSRRSPPRRYSRSPSRRSRYSRSPPRRYSRSPVPRRRRYSRSPDNDERRRRRNSMSPTRERIKSETERK
jgi:FUS-interacting serine-arginine-rich protein 1